MTLDPRIRRAWAWARARHAAFMAATPAQRLLAYGTALFVVLVLWSTLGRLDVVSTAVGEVMPVSRVKAVQHLEGGIVSAILVEEGARVDKGQPLVRLDPIRASSELDELAARLSALKIDIARLEVEVKGGDKFTVPPELARDAPDLAKAAVEVFDTRRRRLSHDIAGLETQVSQRQQELSEIAVRIANNRRALQLVTDQVGISENLLSRELTSRMVHLDLVRQQQTLKGQLDADQAAVPRIESTLKEARERLGSAKENFIEQARTDLADARQQLDELSQRMLKFQSAQDRTVLRAPVEGVVKSIAVATEGGVIQPGQTVLEIVPIEDKLVVEAKLPVQDIGYVRVGQSARVTLASADAAAFGHIDGTVQTVSPDATVTNDGRAFYKIRIVTDRNRFESGERIYQLYPGMQVQCGIRIGTRSVAAYLLSPWFQSLRFSFEER
ncbi:MAG: HlyD family type I secretion periplasmic adaptor subunit [Actinomycetota bacterium]